MRRISLRWKAATHVGEIGEPTGGVFWAPPWKHRHKNKRAKKLPCACAHLRSRPPLSLPLVDLDSQARWRRLVDPWREGFFRQGTDFLLPLPTSQRLNIWAVCVCTILTSNWSQFYLRTSHFNLLRKHNFAQISSKSKAFIKSVRISLNNRTLPVGLW